MLVLKARCLAGEKTWAGLARILLVGLWAMPWVAPRLCGAAPEAYDVWQLEQEAGQQKPITAILQSASGYLWLGTYHGLVRFDGVRSVVFDAGNTPGLANGLITSLFEGPDGSLWIGHETGHLSRFYNGTFQAMPLGTNWPGGSIEAITTDAEGSVWLLNDIGVLFRLTDGKTTLVPGGATPTRKAVIARSAGGVPWIVCGGRLSTLEHGVARLQSVKGSNPGDYFERILPSHDGGLWILMGQQLRKWRAGQWTGEVRECPRTPGAVSCLLETRSGAVLAGTYRDGMFLSGPDGPMSHFSRTNGLSHNWVRSLCEDREGNIWVGTAAGLDGLRVRKVQMLSASDSFQGCGVLSFCITGPDSAWVGTEGAGLYHYEGGAWTAYTQTNGLPNLFVWSVLQTAEKELFVGTWGGGLVRKTGDRFESPAPLNQITAPVVCLYQSRDGRLWIGTTLGLYCYFSNQVTFVAGKDRLAFPDVRALTESADGTIWLGLSGGGLASLRGDTLRQFRKGDGVGSDFIICLEAEADGTIWAGSSDNGLVRLSRGQFATITPARGLPNPVICQIAEDGRGDVWAASHAGLLRANKADLNRCADGTISSVHWLGYGKAEGMASLTCSGGFEPGAAQSQDGRLWFPTIRGLAIVDPAKVATNSAVPPVVIEELIADNQAIPLPDRAGRQDFEPVSIPPGRQRFELRYTGLSFSSPDKVRFKYRLEGLEPDWTDAGTKRVAEYSYLRPGKYRFVVTACNNDGLWNEQPTALAFTVLPFFWQTWWFEAGSGGLLSAGLVGSVVVVSRRRVRRKLEQSERERALERERSRIARDIHDDLGASLTRITMLSQSVRAELDNSPAATMDVDQIYTTARELTRAMDEIVWAVNPKHDTLDSLVTYLGRFAQQFLSSAGIRCRLEVPVYLPGGTLTSEVRHNVFLAFKEALHNIVKHAAATEVRVSLQANGAGFELMVSDNGRGFVLDAERPAAEATPDAARLGPGNGLLNMRKRLEDIGGRCQWRTAPGEGTRVTFVIKTHDS